MLIETYFQAIENLILSCKLVINYSLLTDKRSDYEGFIRGKIEFIDGKVLHIREFVDVENTLERDMYSYQYMDILNNLIFRYDNAEHHKNLNLPSYPHHKHEAREDNILASKTPTLKEVLAEITENYN